MRETDPGPWCTRCGAPGIAAYLSLDPTRPIGDCRRNGPGRKGCGQIGLTTRRAEAEAADLRWRRRYVTARHKDHKAELRPYHLCTRCEAEGIDGALFTPGPDAAGA